MAPKAAVKVGPVRRRTREERIRASAYLLYAIAWDDSRDELPSSSTLRGYMAERVCFTTEVIAEMQGIHARGGV